jgi:xylulokinase
VASRAIITQHGQGHRVAAIAVTGQMHGLVTRDASGRSVGNAITWQDRRSAITLPSLLDQLPSDHWAKIGERVAPGYQAASWHCVSQSAPARLATAAKLLLPKDEIIARLSGRYVTDHSDAIGTGWYDVSTKTWDTAVCDAAGFRVSALPEIVAPGSIIGSLSKEAASHLDLDPGIPVVIAGGDAAVAAFGSGAMESGTPLLMLSTGTQILEATWSNDLAATWPSANPSGLPTRLRVTTTLTGGNTIDWSERIFGRPEDDPELGSESPLFFPYLVGEHKHPAVHFGSGAFVGLQDQHERVDFANAVVEGVALATAGAWVRNGGEATSDSLGTGPVRLGRGALCCHCAGLD